MLTVLGHMWQLINVYNITQHSHTQSSYCHVGKSNCQWPFTYIYIWPVLNKITKYNNNTSMHTQKRPF